VKAKGKARADGLELLSNATLKLKAGVHYALIGRNGTGKSSKSFSNTHQFKIIEEISESMV
jgi:ABC-type polysaccharide/polyol phosphate transport system ATPase subunit